MDPRAAIHSTEPVKIRKVAFIRGTLVRIQIMTSQTKYKITRVTFICQRVDSKIKFQV